MDGGLKTSLAGRSPADYHHSGGMKVVSKQYPQAAGTRPQEDISRSSDYITRLLMARNLQVFKGLDRRMGGGHPIQGRFLVNESHVHQSSSCDRTDVERV